VSQTANPCRIEWWSLDPAVPGAWVNDYMKPFIRFVDRGRARESGVDCWGALRLILWEQLGLMLPDFSSEYSTDADRAELARLMDREKAGLWAPVWESRAIQHLKPLRTPREAPPNGLVRPFDGLHLPIAGDEGHVGVAAGGTTFLHAERGSGVKLDDWASLRWSARMARGGVYRHRALLLPSSFAEASEGRA
jgi:cell wall-associated NlpC family hydrolase